MNGVHALTVTAFIHKLKKKSNSVSCSLVVAWNCWRIMLHLIKGYIAIVF